MQTKLDFSGKKTERITFAASEELKAFLEDVAKRVGCDSLGEYVAEAAIEKATSDKGQLLLLENRNAKVRVNMGTV